MLLFSCVRVPKDLLMDEGNPFISKAHDEAVLFAVG